MLGNFLQQTTSAGRRRFLMHFFLGALRVNSESFWRKQRDVHAPSTRNFYSTFMVNVLLDCIIPNNINFSERSNMLDTQVADHVSSQQP